VIVVINKQEMPRPRGRPRNFDRTDALERAMETFWRLGYEGASIADLTAQMRITPQSLYAAFGSKSALYREALTRYQETRGAFSIRALAEESTAIAGIERLLRESAAAFCTPGQPPGCMVATAVLTCAVENQAENQYASNLRKQTLASIRQRVEVAIAEGEFPREINSDAVARLIGSTIQGMSIQAHDGASEKDLLGVAEIVVASLKQLLTPSSPCA